MLRLRATLPILAVALFAQPIEARSTDVPGVTEVAPGVRQIDGNKVPSTNISFSALKAAIENDRSFSAIKKLFTVNGIASSGPSGTTTYMYKVHDPQTDKDGVAILFVKGGRILDYLIT